MISRMKRILNGTRSGRSMITTGAITMNRGIIRRAKNKRTTNATIRSRASEIANCALGSVIERSSSASRASRAETGVEAEIGARAAAEMEAGSETGVEVEIGTEVGAGVGAEIGTGTEVEAEAEVETEAEVGAGAGGEVEAGVASGANAGSEIGAETEAEAGAEVGGPGTELIGSELKLCSPFFFSGRALSASFSSSFAWAIAME